MTKQKLINSLVLSSCISFTAFAGHALYYKKMPMQRFFIDPLQCAYACLLASTAIPALILSKISKKHSSKSVVENPELSAGIFYNTAIATSLMFYSQFPRELMHIKHAIIPFTAGSGIYTYFFLKNLSKFNQPYIKNFINGLSFALKINKASKQKNTSTLEKLIQEEANRIYRDPSHYYSQIASTEMQKNNPDIEKVIAYEKKSLNQKKCSLLDKIVNYPLTLFIESKLFPKYRGHHLGKALYAYKYNDEKTFIQEYHSFINQEQSIASKAAYVFAIEAFLEKKTSNNLEQEKNIAWKSLIGSIVKEKQFFESIDNRKVYTVSIHNFLRTMLILREGPKEFLEQEMKNISSIKNALTANCSVVEPIHISEHNGSYYLVEKFAPGNRLTENLSRSALQKSITCTKLIHNAFERKTEKECMKRATEKLRKIELPDDIKNLFASSMSILFDYASNYAVFDCDAHADNFFVQKTKQGLRIIALDKPSRGYVLPEEDITKLVNGHSFYKQLEQGWNQKKEDICNNYDADKKFFYSCASLTPYKALSYAAYSIKFPIKLNNALSFLKNAIFDINMLIEETKPNKKNYSLYKIILKALSQTQSIIA
ncbi:hypothetical protein HYV79_01055 [Candidatus Woesearchaeota archaeon]|nr:hypothetical protein [Candidatus Woesearchaeota archaeon]